MLSKFDERIKAIIAVNEALEALFVILSLYLSMRQSISELNSSNSLIQD